ncbi:hypothetical protein ScPMuIL_006688 [Solemya velum]
MLRTISGLFIGFWCLTNSCIQGRSCYYLFLSNAYKELCFDCPAGKWGDECGQSCSSLCQQVSYKTSLNNTSTLNSSFCDSANDRCYECEAKKFGPRCDLSCSSCDAVNGCDSRSGNCFACLPGHYGPHCHDCPDSCTDEDCDQATSACNTNCANDWSGFNCACFEKMSKGVAYCSQCATRFYGTHCDKHCPSTCYGYRCHQSTGLCDGCITGWYGDKCDCRGNCDESRCSVLGHCHTCSPGYWGEDCLQVCLHNCGKNGCDRNSGVCRGCETGWHGDQCDTKYRDPDSGEIAGVVIGSAVVGSAITLLVVFVVIYVRRRQAEKKPAPRNYETPTTPQDEPYQGMAYVSDEAFQE